MAILGSTEISTVYIATCTKHVLSVGIIDITLQTWSALRGVWGEVPGCVRYRVFIVPREGQRLTSEANCRVRRCSSPLESNVDLHFSNSFLNSVTAHSKGSSVLKEQFLGTSWHGACLTTSRTSDIGSAGGVHVSILLGCSNDFAGAIPRSCGVLVRLDFLPAWYAQ